MGIRLHVLLAFMRILIMIAASESSIHRRTQPGLAQLAFSTKPYVNFVISQPANVTNASTILDIHDCSTRAIRPYDTTLLQWARATATDEVKDKCQTFLLQRLPWLGATVFGFSLSSSFVTTGQRWGFGFDQTTLDNGTGPANLTLSNDWDPVWQPKQQFTLQCEGRPNDKFFAKSCKIILGLAAANGNVCLTAPNSTTGGNGPLGTEYCANSTVRWDLVSNSARFTNTSHCGGWAC